MSSVAVPVHLPPKPSAGALRSRLEAALADRIPAAFTLYDRTPEMASSGIAALDGLAGGLPRGALTEVFGPASSGRSSVLLAALAAATGRGEACALVDAGDAFCPESAAGAGVALKKLLWVRCGADGTRQMAHGISLPIRADALPQCRTAELPNRKAPHEGHKGHTKATKHDKAEELDQMLGPPALDIGIWGYGAAEEMLRIRGDHFKTKPLPIADCGLRIANPEELRVTAQKRQSAVHNPQSSTSAPPPLRGALFASRGTSRGAYARIEQALKAADLLLAGGGFGLVALDLGDMPAEAARRVPLTSWFRFRRAVENTPAVLLLISPLAVTQSCAALVVKLQPSAISTQPSAKTVAPPHARLLTGLSVHADVVRSPAALRKPARSAHAEFTAEAQWAG